MNPYRLYAAGGILAVEAPIVEGVIPGGFTRREGPHHITLLDIDDGKAIRASRGLSTRAYEAMLDAIESAGSGPFGSPVRLGIGMATSGENIAYFEVFDWHEAQRWRAAHFSLGRKDFHATLYYFGADVRGVAKDVSSIVLP